MEEEAGPSSPPTRPEQQQDEEQDASSSAGVKRRRSPSGNEDGRREPASSTSTSTASRRPRRSDPDAASRGRRMFGLLKSTLNKANADNARIASGEAGRKRAELEARLQEKQRAQSEKMRLEKQLGDDLRGKLRQAFDVALDIEAMDDAIRLRKAQKRRMASFLVTTSELCAYDGRESRSTAVDKRTLAPAVPLVLAPVTHAHPHRFKRLDGHPVYFLPKAMLSRQDDTLDEQEDHVDAEIDEVDEAWAKERAEMEGRMAVLQASIHKIKLEMEDVDGGHPKSAQALDAPGQGEVEMARDDAVPDDEEVAVPVSERTGEMDATMNVA